MSAACVLMLLEPLVRVVLVGQVLVVLLLVLVVPAVQVLRRRLASWALRASAAHSLTAHAPRPAVNGAGLNVPHLFLFF